jgi:YaiO family outer membrane protein
MRYLRSFVTPLIFFAILGASPTLSKAADEPSGEDILTQARSLATSDHRPEALEMLKKYLAEHPQDTDARVLYGIILSWEGHYPESRQELEQVLATNRTHGDAVLALINVELWSDHPERAEQLTREALVREPNNTTLLLARARALKSLSQQPQAAQTLDRLLEVDPRNQEAIKLRRELSESSRLWELSFGHSYEWFSDDRDAWNQDEVALKRRTRAGSLIGRFSHANRFSLSSNQTEVDFYPRFRPGTYAYVNVGYSPDATLYPTYRFGTDLYQSLGHGLEASAGYRRLGFSSRVNIYTTSLAKYYGAWLFTGRVYITPDSLGTSDSFSISARRYFGEGTDYVDLRYGRGASPTEVHSLQDILVLNSSSFGTEMNRMIERRWLINFRAGLSQEERLFRSNLWHYQLSGTLYFRF